MSHLKLSLLIPILLLTACSSLNGSIQNNRYVSPNNLSVEVPPIAEMQAKDGKNGNLNYVDFVPGGSYWMMDHAYSLEWFILSVAPDKKLLKQLPLVMKHSFERDNAKFNIPTCEFITIHGTQASRCVMEGIKDDVRAGIMGTSFGMNGRLVNAYVIYPLKHKPSLQEYNNFINSIKIH